MNLKQHENRDDMTVWLSQNEVAQLLETANDTQQRIAFSLGARCGPRSHEVLTVVPEDIVDTGVDTMLRVWYGKGEIQNPTLIMPASLRRWRRWRTKKTETTKRKTGMRVKLKTTNRTSS